MKRWPLVVAVVMLLGTWGVLLSLSHGEPALPRKPFTDLPMNLGDRWQGKEVGLSQDVLDVLKLSDYTMRIYLPAKVAEPNKHGTPVWLYVGYYQSQRTGATYHSPKNCLPGAGWQFMESDQVAVPVQNGSSVTINKVLIQKGLEKQLILYWYQDRGRIVASEYSAKMYMIWDAMTRNRTDGSLVRISVPVDRSTDEAFAEGVQFMQDLYPLLGNHLPS